MFALTAVLVAIPLLTGTTGDLRAATWGLAMVAFAVGVVGFLGVVGWPGPAAAIWGLWLNGGGALFALALTMMSLFFATKRGYLASAALAALAFAAWTYGIMAIVEGDPKDLSSHLFRSDSGLGKQACIAGVVASVLLLIHVGRAERASRGRWQVVNSPPQHP
jgi:hypothetical protein